MKPIIRKDNVRPIIALLYQFIVVSISTSIWFLSELILVNQDIVFFILIVYPILVTIFPIVYFRITNRFVRIKDILKLILIVLLLCSFVELFFYNSKGNFKIEFLFQYYRSWIYLINFYLFQPLMFIIVFFYYINDNQISNLPKKSRYIYSLISILLFSFMFYPYLKMILAGFLIGFVIFIIYGKFKNVYLLIATEILITIITSLIVIYR